MNIRNEFARCAICPNLDVCLRCFNGGSVCASHDKSHPWFKAKATKYPVEWSVILPTVHSTTKRSNMLEEFSFLQYRDISPADYGRLLLLDKSSKTVPLHEHLCNALPEVGSSLDKTCDFCSVPLSIDKTARVFPCEHTVHHSCAASIILSALSQSECEGIAVSKIVCPFCSGGNENGAKSTLLFPKLQREPKTRATAQKEIGQPRDKPCDVTNVIGAFDNCNVTEAFSVRSCHGINNTTSSSTEKTKENNHLGSVLSLPTQNNLSHTQQPGSAHIPTLSVDCRNPRTSKPNKTQKGCKSSNRSNASSISKGLLKAKSNVSMMQPGDSLELGVIGVSKSR